MGVGTAVSIWSLIGGIFLIIIGGALCLTIIGIIIGVPLIIAGIGLIGGGAVAGGAIGAGKIAHKTYKESKSQKREDIKFRVEMQDKGHCYNCGAKIKKEDSFCSKCGTSFSSSQVQDKWECESCKQKFKLGVKEQIELEKKGKVKVKCPHCHKLTLCEE